MVSPIWSLFRKKDIVEKKAKCSICSQWISYKHNTSVMLNHALAVHKLSYDDLKKRQKDSEVPKVTPSNGMNDIRCQQAKFFASCCLPYEVVENDEFKKFMNILRADVKPISAETLASDIRRLDVDYRHEIESSLKDRRDLILILDGWTSANAEYELFCILAGFYDGEGVLSQSLVGICDTPRTKAIDLHGFIVEELKKSGLKLYQFKAMISDGASNLVALAKTLNIPKYHCAAHIIHLIITDAVLLKPITALVKKCRNICAKLNHSVQLRSELKKIAVDSGNSHALPKSYSPTRWNGIRDMLQSTKNHIGPMSSIPQFTNLTFTGKELRLLSFVINVLEPFQEMSTRFESKENQYSEVVPHLKLLTCKAKRIISKAMANDDNKSCHDQIASFGNRLIRNLENRILDASFDPLLRLPTLLDARYGYSPIVYTDQEWEEVENLLLSKFSFVCSSPTPAPQDSDDDFDTMDSFLGTRVSATSDSERSRAAAELESYKKFVCENRPSSSANPMLFWMSQSNYPLISGIAKESLSIPASSASAERIFSKCGRIVANKLRNRMSSIMCSSLLMVQAGCQMSSNSHDADDWGVCEEPSDDSEEDDEEETNGRGDY